MGKAREYQALNLLWEIAKLNGRFALWVLSVAVGMASSIFMGLVFYTEGILGMGMLFIEPNVWIARAELVAIILGIISTLALFIIYARRSFE